MRRIDLLCKLLGPLAVASIAAASIDVAIWTTLGTNIVSIAPEYICVAQVSASLALNSTRPPDFANTTPRSTRKFHPYMGAPQALLVEAALRKDRVPA